MADEFHDVIQHDLVEPLEALCRYFAEQEALDEFTFFSHVLFMLGDPKDEPMVLAGVIELSRCAFVGLSFDEVARVRIDSILERAITIAHTMSASP